MTFVTRWHTFSFHVALFAVVIIAVLVSLFAAEVAVFAHNFIAAPIAIHFILAIVRGSFPGFSSSLQNISFGAGLSLNDNFFAFVALVADAVVAVLVALVEAVFDINVFLADVAASAVGIPGAQREWVTSGTRDSRREGPLAPVAVLADVVVAVLVRIFAAVVPAVANGFFVTNVTRDAFSAVVRRALTGFLTEYKSVTLVALGAHLVRVFGLQFLVF